jgi:hypothetical protein
VSALAVLVLGAAASVVAVASGGAAEDAAETVAAAKSILHEHEELGEMTRNAFLGLTALFACIVAATTLSARLGRCWFVGTSLVFLLPYFAGVAVLVNTSHKGGLLVHHYGVHAPISGPGATPPARDRDDD